MGINDRQDLSRAEAVLRQRINRAHMARGVTLRDPATTCHRGRGDDRCRYRARSGRGAARSLPHRLGLSHRRRLRAHRRGGGGRCAPEALYRGQRDELGAGTQIGPFSHLRPGSVIGAGAHIGNFVELKQTRVWRWHQSQPPGLPRQRRDWQQGEHRLRHHHLQLRWRLEAPDGHRDDVFVGSDTQLVAPVRVGKGSDRGTLERRSLATCRQGALTLSRVPQVDNRTTPKP